jgi:hypothetical protein
MKLIILTLFVFFSLLATAQNKTTLSGYILDAVTKEPLIDANISVENEQQGTSSSKSGFFSLTTKSELPVKLKISFIGYKKQTVTINSKNTVTILLQPGLNIDEVEISGTKKKNIVRSNQTGVVKLQTKEINELPNFFGEMDIIKVMQLTPGVQSGGEGQSNLYVRGGSPDQNLILLDGIPIYYIAHWGGFVSVFNSGAISNTELIKGGFPARYGSRLSSVVDITTRNGNKQDYSAQGSIGLLSCKFLYEGPIKKDKASFLISARKSLLPILWVVDGDLFNGFHDFNAKINYSYSDRDNLSLSGYYGNDNVWVKNKIYSDGLKQKDKKTLKWGNRVVSLNWNHVFSNKLFCNSVVGYTYYMNKNKFHYTSKTDTTNSLLDSEIKSSISDFIVTPNFHWFVNNNWDIRFGPSVCYHKFTPNSEDYYTSENGETGQDYHYLSIEKAIETSFYAENNINTKHFGANIGGRFSSYFINDKSYMYFEPRLLLNAIITDNFSMKYSYSEMNQYVHLLSYSGAGMPTDYWMPSNENIEPQHSIQHSLGLNGMFCKGQYQVGIEGYYKEMSNLIAFKPGESLVGHLDDWTETVEKNGTGTSKGIELFLQKLTGKTTGWFGGTLSKADRKFANLNNGETFPFKYDRLVDLSIVVVQKLSDNITLSATWAYGTGYPVTLPVERYESAEGDIYVYDKINNVKMRDYHRLDLALNYKRKTPWGEATWTFSIFNAYNRKNPYYYYFQRETIIIDKGQSLVVTSGDMKLYQKSLYPFFPSFAYSFKF